MCSTIENVIAVCREKHTIVNIFKRFNVKPITIILF